jgi:hypothetical protein
MSLAFVAVNVAEKYRPVAARGGLLCFVINNLHKIHSHVLFVVTEYIVSFFLCGICCAEDPSILTGDGDPNGSGSWRYPYI